MKKLLRAGWLVMAAALMAGLAACTSDDSGSEVVEPQAVTPNAVSTIHVTVGAGIGGDSEAQTRSNVTDDGGNRKLIFTEGDRLFVSAVVTADWGYIVAGTLSIDNNTITDDGTGASFSGDLKVYHLEEDNMVPSAYNFTEADPLDECTGFQAGLIAKDMSDDCYIIDKYYNFGLDYTKSIAVDNPEDNHDDCVSTLMKTALKVESNFYATEHYGEEEPKMFRGFAGDPILNCEISGLTSGTAYTVTVLGDGNESNYNNNTGSKYNVTFASTVTATSDGKARFAISLRSGIAGSGYYWTLKLVGGGETRYVKLGQKEMYTNKVYRVNREAQLDIVDLSSVTTSSSGVEDLNGVPTLRLRDGQVVTGTLDGSTADGKVKIEIAPGATVTLYNAHINGHHYSDTECRWAGITCLGDATIVLSGENTVTNFNRYYPAILAAHNDTGSGDEYTLTISGSGSLTATGTYLGAAIGGGHNIDCGNIEITDGTVTANGGGTSAAIGGGEAASCGSITISGTASVTATTDSDGGAGIGSGYVGGSGASCGDITISGTASVTATGGGNAAGIGSGGAEDENANSCGVISISGACTVNATGGENAAGIGTGSEATCGNISITGGTVTAQGGENAAGIGCGVGSDMRKSECGDITIEDGGDFTSVTAIRGQGSYIRPIGHSSWMISSDYNTCGTITFGFCEVYNAENDPSTYNTNGGGLYFSVTTTIPTGEDNDDDRYTDNTWVLTKFE